MEDQNCDMCTAPMEETKSIGTKESGLKWRQTWFKCPICGFEKKVNGSGKYQDEIYPANTEYYVNKMFKEQEQNNQ